MQPKLPFRKSLVASVVIEPKIPRVDYRVGPHAGRKLVDDPELAIGVAEQ